MHIQLVCYKVLSVLNLVFLLNHHVLTVHCCFGNRKSRHHRHFHYSNRHRILYPRKVKRNINHYIIYCVGFQKMENFQSALIIWSYFKIIDILRFRENNFPFKTPLYNQRQGQSEPVLGITHTTCILHKVSSSFSVKERRTKMRNKQEKDISKVRGYAFYQNEVACYRFTLPL